MPTNHPRINVVLEKPLFASLSRLARRDGSSLSLKARDLIREAMEMEEDAHWSKKADQRAETFHPRKALSHQKVWQKAGLKSH